MLGPAGGIGHGVFLLRSCSCQALLPWENGDSKVQVSRRNLKMAFPSPTLPFFLTPSFLSRVLGRILSLPGNNSNCGERWAWGPACTCASMSDSAEAAWRSTMTTACWISWYQEGRLLSPAEPFPALMMTGNDSFPGRKIPLHPFKTVCAKVILRWPRCQWDGSWDFPPFWCLHCVTTWQIIVFLFSLLNCSCSPT